MLTQMILVVTSFVSERLSRVLKPLSMISTHHPIAARSLALIFTDSFHCLSDFAAHFTVYSVFRSAHML